MPGCRFSPLSAAAGATRRRISRRHSSRTSCAIYYRYELFQEPARETLTFRNNTNETALPMRHLGSFLPGAGVGGAGIHWNGQNWRFLPTDFMVRSQTTQRYGAQMIPQDMTIQDWGVTYDELEPYYDKWEYLCGISGKAGNIKGQIQSGGNPFEGPRSRDYPNPPMEMTYAPVLFGQAAKDIGLHPFPGARLRTCLAPIQTRSACSSDRAPIAASAKSSRAAITRRQARRPRYCRCSCASQISRSRPKARSSRSTSTTRESARSASPMSTRKAKSTSNRPI